MRALSLAAAGLLIAAAPARDAPGLLTATELDPARVLPPPPATSSPQGQAELVELRTMLATTTPAERDAAAALGKFKDVSLFAGAVPGLDLASLPATARLFDMVRTTEKDVVDRGKDEFKRPRPWIVDPAITPCSRGDDPLSSYPSGHATMAYSFAGVLARLIPARAPRDPRPRRRIRADAADLRPAFPQRRDRGPGTWDAGRRTADDDAALHRGVRRCPCRTRESTHSLDRTDAPIGGRTSSTSACRAGCAAVRRASRRDRCRLRQRTVDRSPNRPPSSAR